MEGGPVSSFFNTMDDSSDEEMMIVYYYYHTKRNRKRRIFWVHPYIERNFHHQLFVAARELNLSDAKFLCFYRMSKDSYLQLVQLISPAIHKKKYKYERMCQC